MITFYQAVMRPHWRRLELGMAEAVWQEARHRFDARVLGPHFEALCREHALRAGAELFGQAPGEVVAGTVADPARRSQIEIDVVAFAPAMPDRPAQVLALGEVKWGEVMGEGHLTRLRRARSLQAAKGYDTSDTVLACYSGAGFTSELVELSKSEPVVLVDPERIYATG